jgi:hypothetical protein
MLMKEWVDTPSTRYLDWICGHNEFSSTGFPSKSYYNSDIRDEMEKILIRGVY